MKKLKIAGAVVVGLFLLVTLVGFALPSRVRIERSIVVNAPPSSIYPLIADFKNGWSQWNTFDDEDPTLQYKFQGPDLGVGATQVWDSPKIGDGKMIITKADPERGVELDLVLMQDSFRLSGSLLCEPQGGGTTTKLVWVDEMDTGANPYRRYMGQMVKGPIGQQFDKGLARIKELAEGSARSAKAN
jgi:hypothetical protein